jgi:predicted nuclease of predicted toxin-antitoxin system
MRILLDANMPRSAVSLLQSHGHAVEHARDIGLGNVPDAQIATRAIETGAVLMTRDLDFADIRRYPPPGHPGIVVLRMADDAIASEIVQLLERFIQRTDLTAKLPGHLVILEPARVRFRPPI